MTVVSVGLCLGLGRNVQRPLSAELVVNVVSHRFFWEEASFNSLRFRSGTV